VCDAPARWGFVCDALIKVYKNIANNAEVISPISKISANHKIGAFVDDTVLMNFNNKQLCYYILLFLQSDAQTWEKLLYTSGGKLEIPKCNFGVFDWEYDNYGRALLKLSNKSILNVQNSENNTNMQIQQMEPFESYKYVGIHIALDGNQKDQISNLSDKCRKMVTVFSQPYFNSKDSEQGFMTIYTPLIRYALPATSITKKKLCIIQQPVISSALSRLGYNRNMPRAVIHASKLYGGAGILDLYTEQGCGQVLNLLSYLRLQQYLHNPIISLIESYWISSGKSNPPFIDTSPTPYVQAPWITSIKEFLHQLRCTIHIPILPQLPPLREHDSPIMQQPFTNNYSKSTLEMINACRIHLQVHSMSEITNHQGNMLLDCVHQGQCNDTTNLLYGRFLHQQCYGQFNTDHQQKHGKHGKNISTNLWIIKRNL
jgi:hypothetical protein